MYAYPLPVDADEAVFRAAARHCLALELSPKTVAFVSETQASLLPPPPPEFSKLAPFSVPRAFGDLLKNAICHSAPDRFDLLYDVLWRVLHGERWLAERAADPAVARLGDYAKNVGRDIHKMHAFLRFRPRETEHGPVYTAWFEPQHYILKRAVPFFVDRFAGMNWLIATPQGTAAWRESELTYGPAPQRKPAQGADAVLDELWVTYFRTTFNPARVRTKAMLNQMPKLYWSNMPEAQTIPDLVAGAQARVAQMQAREADQPQLFADRIAARERPAAAILDTPIDALRAEATTCRRCPLFGPATQTVFGEGPTDARLVFVGEQPGDEEDLAGRPFIGPAGRIFNLALEEAGIVRKHVYLTNAVKHFKYEPRGKRRIHKRPSTAEVQHCGWWLGRELVSIEPDLIVALGGTAAHALSGRAVSVTKERGAMRFGHGPGFVTVHPSYLLRLPNEQDKATEYRRFVEDLRQVRILVSNGKAVAERGVCPDST